MDVLGATEIRREPRELSNEHHDRVTGYEIGSLKRDGFEIGLYEFEIKSSYKIGLNRVGLRSLVKSYLNYGVDATIVVYWHGQRNGDNVTGYTMRQIEDALIGVNTWNKWRDNIKNKGSRLVK